MGVKRPHALPRTLIILNYCDDAWKLIVYFEYSKYICTWLFESECNQHLTLCLGNRLRVRAESAAAEELPRAVELEPFVDTYEVTHLLPYRNHSVELLLYSSAGRRQVPAARASLTCRTLPAAPRADLSVSLRVRVRPDGLSAHVSWQPPPPAHWNGPPADYRLRLVKLGAPPPPSQPQQRQRQFVSAANANTNANSSHQVCYPQRAHAQNTRKLCERFRACHICPESSCVHTQMFSVHRRYLTRFRKCAHVFSHVHVLWLLRYKWPSGSCFFHSSLILSECERSFQICNLLGYKKRPPGFCSLD